MTNPLIAARDAFAARHPEQRFEREGRDWGYIDCGEGPALLLIPGTLGRADIFWQQIEALQDRLRIVAVSYPAKGGVAEWAGDLVALLDTLEIDKAVVLGSSLGGYLAQYIAAEAPARVTALVAANTLHSVKGLDQRMPYALDLDTASIEDLRGGFRAGLSAWADTHTDQRDLVALLMGEVAGRIPEAEMRARLKALKHGPELPPLTMPHRACFTIEADDDPLIPAEMRNAVRERISPAAAYRFTSGGHFPYIARRERYTSVLCRIMDLQCGNPVPPDGGEVVL